MFRLEEDMSVKIITTMALVVLLNYLVGEMLPIQIIHYKPIMITLMVVSTYFVVSVIMDVILLCIRGKMKKEH